ncbi:MAG: PBP1A family penicillin-binding protein [Acidobacteriia bacterium]|nr:PBP1A family penicillin-binding protein [Methyloceanibacter sp.]MCL6491737.1 PBP1A family penicillin-binding protein [Terriglobia bacterium]
MVLRALFLRPPDPAPQAAEGAGLQQPARRRWRWLVWLRWAVIGAVWAGFAGGLLFLWLIYDLPRPEQAFEAARRPSLRLVDRSGQLFASFGDVVGEPLHLVELPPFLPAAVVAIEDRRFYRHHGIDLLGVARAAWTDLFAGHVVQGGSTLTQQVAKTLFLSGARTWRRKAQELLLTLWLEEHFTKREILEIWLNRVYFGAGAWGVDAAARLYFGISARRLVLWQAAMLAGLPKAPSRFNPLANPEAAKARARQVLAAMVAVGAIRPEVAKQAAGAMALASPAAKAEAGWFADWVAEELQPVLPPGKDALVHTTLDLRMQRVVENSLTGLLQGPGAEAGVGQGAVVILEAASGAVRAMAGGRSYRQSPFNRATLAHRQPGSTFKPFVWLTALEHGATPEAQVLDAPLRIGAWQPENFEKHYLGHVSLQEALAQSANTAAVRLLLQSGGPEAVARVAHRLGIESTLPENASLALGTGEVSVLEITAAYAPFFNGGRRVTPTGLAALDIDGKATPLSQKAPRQVISREHAAMMARMLAAVVEEGTGRAAAVRGRRVAGKTGTTQDFRDAWFIGETEGLLIGIWLGNDDGTPMRGVTGGSLPARLFHEIAAALPPAGGERAREVAHPARQPT